MADTLVGFGLGLTGTPKDYTSLIAAQERQRAADEAAARKQKLNQYQDVAKSLVVDKSLPYQKEDYVIKLGETLEKVKKAIDSGDYNAQVMALGDFSQFSKERKAEYDAFENYRNMYNKGQINPDIKVTPDQIYNAKSRQDVANLAGGDFSFNPDLGVLNFYTTNKYDLVQAYKKAAENVPVQTWKTVNVPDAYGTKMSVTVPDEKEYLKNLEIEWNTNRDARENAIRNYKRKNNLSGKDYDTPQEMQDLLEKSEQDYLKEGLEWGLKQKYNVIRQPGKGFSFSVSVGGGETYGAGDLTEKTIQSGFTQPDGSLQDRPVRLFSTAIKPYKGVGYTTNSLRSTNNNELLKQSDIVDFEYGELGVTPTWAGEFTFNGKKSRGVTGKMISEDMMALAEQQGLVKYIVTMAGEGKIRQRVGGKVQTDEKGNEITEPFNAWREAKDVIGAAKSSLTSTNAQVLEKQYQDAQKLAKELNEKYRKTTPASTTKTPSTEKKPVEFAQPSSSKTTTSPKGKKVYTKDEWKAMTPSQRQSAINRGESFK